MRDRAPPPCPPRVPGGKAAYRVGIQPSRAHHFVHEIAVIGDARHHIQQIRFA
jgi:hypothetical protein